MVLIQGPPGGFAVTGRSPEPLDKEAFLSAAARLEILSEEPSDYRVGLEAIVQTVHQPVDSGLSTDAVQKGAIRERPKAGRQIQEPAVADLWVDIHSRDRHGPNYSRHCPPTRQPGGVLVIDAANVIGSQPTGWWRDRAGVARRFVEQLRAAARHGQLPLPIVVVLEGAARAGSAEADLDGVRVVHATHSGDDALVAQTAAATTGVIFVTSDRALRERVRQLGAETVGPRWLTDRLRPDQE